MSRSQMAGAFVFPLVVLLAAAASVQGGSGGSNCCIANGGLGCDDVECEAAVCDFDPFCCDVEWDGICAEEAADLCPICAVCGNGVVEAGEQCDDGNTTGGDGCNSACQLEPVGACCLGPTCESLSQGECDAAGGQYQGDGIPCVEGDTQIYAANPNLAIPDNNPSGVSHTITIPASAQILDLDVDLTLLHTWVGDLCISLVHNGVTVNLVQRPGDPTPGCVVPDFGCDSNNLNVILDDEGTGGALDSLSCPGGAFNYPVSPPNYLPIQPLSAFDSLDASGNWTLTVSDYAPADVGTLVSWSLHVTTAGGPVTKCQGCTSNAQCADDNDCTSDICDLDTGSCENTDLPAGAACGSGADTDCDNPDTCDGQGQCQNNSEPAGVACGDPSDDGCTNPDGCDGVGLCQPNHEPNGTPCGEQMQCLEGVCTTIPDCSNDVDCSDGDPCTNDVCTAGVCSNPPATAGTPCGSSADADCDNPDGCDGAGACLPNPAPDGAACSSDGNACTADTCSGGVCAHSLAAAGTPCGSSADTQCDNPDACNAAGQCQTNNAANGSACNDGNACTTGDACQAGACVGGPAPNCNDGDGCTTDSCKPSAGCQHSPAFCPPDRICQDGVCVPAPQCITDADCDDDNPCTQDRCVEDRCQTSRIADCCVDDSDCAADEECDLASGTCEPMVGPAEPQPPLPPLGVIASDGNFSDRIRIAWNALSQADEYRVFRCADLNVGTCLAVSDWITATSFDDTSATPGVVYLYRVKARNEDGESDFSAANQGLRAEQPTQEEPPLLCMTNEDCDDAMFCNGAEMCVEGECAAGQSPCSADQTCDEATDSCTDAAGACGSGMGCTPTAPFLGLLLFGLIGLRLARMRRR